MSLLSVDRRCEGHGVTIGSHNAQMGRSMILLGQLLAVVGWRECLAILDLRFYPLKELVIARDLPYKLKQTAFKRRTLTF